MNKLLAESEHCKLLDTLWGAWYLHIVQDLNGWCEQIWLLVNLWTSARGVIIQFPHSEGY